MTSLPVMDWYAKITGLLLLLTSINICSTKISYKEVLAKAHVEEKLKLLVPEVLFRNYNQSRVSKACFEDLAAYEKGLRRRELWALQMMDSSSKISSGILWGNVIDIGTYDECIEVNEKFFEDDDEIRGQHCMYSISPMIMSTDREFPFSPILSVCMPEKCNTGDLVELINTTINSNNKLSSSGLSVSYAACPKIDDLHIDKEFIVFIIVMGLYIGFLSMCTVLDTWNNSDGLEKSLITKKLIQFSYLNNIKAIFSMKFGIDDLPALHGLRALNTIWLMIVHEYFFYILSPLANFMELAKWFVSWQFLIPMVGLYCVETFFVLSGFLTAFTFFKQRQQNKRFNFIYYYLHRMTRLAPSVVAVLYITLMLVPKIPAILPGPRMDWLLDIFVGCCRSKWPSVLFFIQNLVEKDNYCLQQLWSIAADVQLMCISPIILYALHRAPKIGMSILVTLLILSITSYAAILGIYKHPAIYFTQDQSIKTTVRAYEDIYELTYTRASPWLLGIFLGYIIQKKPIKSSQTFVGIGWFITLVSFIFCVIGIKTFTNEDYEYNIYWEMTFAALSKPLWGCIICWIIYVCIVFPNNLLARFLSSKIFLPFSRVSYALCIVHLLFPLIQLGSLKTLRYFSDYAVLQSCTSNVVFSFITAVIFSITFEIPLRNLDRVILNRKKFATNNKEKIK